MAAAATVCFLFLLGASVDLAQGSCRLTGYTEMSIMERLVQSDYVVYGWTKNHVANRVTTNGVPSYVIDAVFEIHCVMKQEEDDVPETITITGVAPRDDCAGTSVSRYMKVGDYAILALRNMTNGGNFTLHEVLPVTSAAIEPMKPYFFALSKICNMQRWQPPYDAAVNRCPICGIADFGSGVSTLDVVNQPTTVCPYVAYSLISNMTACDLYLDSTVDYANAQTCIPATYNQTCSTMLFRIAGATCDCNVVEHTVDVGVGAGEMHVSSLAVMSVMYGLGLLTLYVIL